MGESTEREAYGRCAGIIRSIYCDLPFWSLHSSAGPGMAIVLHDQVFVFFPRARLIRLPRHRPRFEGFTVTVTLLGLFVSAIGTYLDCHFGPDIYVCRITPGSGVSESGRTEIKEVKKMRGRSAFDRRVRRVSARSLGLTSSTFRPKRLKSRGQK